MTSKDNIISLPNSRLRQKSERVGDISPEIKGIIEDMKAATLDWEDSRQHEVGVALAAVQIDKLYRIIIIRDDFNDKHNRQFTVLINPEITKLEGAVEEDYEGCLSVSNLYGRVPRHTKIRVKAMDENGRPVKFKVSDFLARVFQHEIDHLNGVMFVDHIKGRRDAFYRLKDDGKLEELDYDKDVAQADIFR